MQVLGLQGSPRKKGNTNYLMSLFMQEAARLGARVQTIDVTRRNIVPCKELVVCEKKGYCPIDDDMRHDIYGLLRRAEVVVISSPVFFYNVTAQLKALIDRCQTLWARKYKLKLKDPASGQRLGFMLAAGATGGKNLFEGLNLTAKYFFDAIDARFAGSLVYRQIEGPRDMQNHPTVADDVSSVVRSLCQPLINRKKVLFVGLRDASRSQMAAAIAQFAAGDRLDICCAGSRPAEAINQDVAGFLASKGIDMAFRVPQSLERALEEMPPDVVVTLGIDRPRPTPSGAQMLDWDLPDPVEQPAGFLSGLYDDIEKKVHDLIATL